MKQLSLAETGFQSKNPKQTRKERFLAELDQVVPWAQMLALIAPVYPNAGKVGRPVTPLESMLRIHFIQQWFGYSDPAMEEALHDIPVLRRFAGIDAFEDRIPEETTILNFRHLLERHELALQIFPLVNESLRQKGLTMKNGSVVDATLISAPSSTKNQSGERDPEMHQTKKGNQWYFGMKAHIGVDADSGLVHSLETTAANTNDVTVASRLMHGEEDYVLADAVYQGIERRKEVIEMIGERKVRFYVAMRPGKRAKLDSADELGALQEKFERTKAGIRAKVEHPFRVLKRQFGYVKVRYRGLAKNTAQIFTLFALSNLWMVRKKLLQMGHGVGAPV